MWWCCECLQPLRIVADVLKQRRLTESAASKPEELPIRCRIDHDGRVLLGGGRCDWETNQELCEGQNSVLENRDLFSRIVKEGER